MDFVTSSCTKTCFSWIEGISSLSSTSRWFWAQDIGSGVELQERPPSCRLHWTQHQDTHKAIVDPPRSQGHLMFWGSSHLLLSKQRYCCRESGREELIGMKLCRLTYTTHTRSGESSWVSFSFLAATFPVCSRDYEIQLHRFSDASEEAYTAVVYLRVQAPDNSIHASFVMSKTRVAPLKRLTIPSLELCGALLLSKILSHVQRTLEYSSCEVHAWTDSTVVLGWLNGDPRRFKTFVGNRVSQIIDLIAPSKWSHVYGSEEPGWSSIKTGFFPPNWSTTTSGGFWSSLASPRTISLAQSHSRSWFCCAMWWSRSRDYVA